LHNVFLKSEALGWRRLGKACPLGGQWRRSDATYRPRVGVWPGGFGGCGFEFQSVKSDISGIFDGFQFGNDE